VSVQLPPAVDRRGSFDRAQRERYQSAPIVMVAPWSGARRRTWTLADALVHSDIIPLVYGLALGVLTVLTIQSW
jgi:hypothetical protein